MKKIIVTGLMAALVIACGSNNSGENQAPSSPASSDQSSSSGNPSYDPNRGAGKFTKVEISASLDAAKAEAGSKVYSVKCSACHKLTDEKLVGPGWKGVTSRHSAEWIMNFATNTDEMLTKDPKAQAQLEICLVRMPNQNLTDDDARNVYEFMRKNDGIK
ncbi:MAG: cytochrome c [Bacteroidetes bacterium]|nr:cytochrome c [Bacteroidota bacterium]MBS1974012.1 cytochrome c [Bacteroidota bacterium]